MVGQEALFRRLLPKHRDNETLQQEYAKLRAGYHGKKNMDYKLSLFPNREQIHLPDIRLQHHHNFFQMDSVVLTPKLIFILEAKHMRGILEYHGAERQLIQIDGDNQKSYKDPILQARTQAVHMESWLHHAGWHVPVVPFVVSTNQYAIIKNIDEHQDFVNHFITLENLPYKLKETLSKYKDNVLQHSQLKQLAHLLLAQNQPAKTSLIQQLKLKEHHFVKGVVCPECQYFPLQKVYRGWHCNKCKYNGEADAKRVNLDYFLLHQPECITNQICREILGIETIHQSYTLIKSMKFQTSGQNKGRKYFPPKLNEFPQDATPKKFDYSIL